MPTSNYIYIFDTTLRDGEQSPGASMTVDEKLKMAVQLERLGVDIVEAGFPIASGGDFEAVRKIASELTESKVAALCRAKREDIDAVWKALKFAKKPRIHTFIATSDIHLKYKLKKSRQQVLDEAVWAVRYARNLCEDVEFSAEDAVRSDFDYLCQVIESVIEAGATVVNIPDTVGYAIPFEFGDMIRRIRERVKNIDKVILSVHCHNDLGLAVANSISAVVNGARQVECTVNGIGERAGNASLEEFVMALKVRKSLLGFETGIRTEEIYRSSQLLSNLTGIPVQPNKAVVGKNAFAHEAGIHQHGVLSNPLTYEIMTPQSVGIPSNTIVLGKHSGRHALEKRYKELGYDLTKEQLEKAYKLFCEIADRKKEIYDEDLIAILNDQISTGDIDETYKLVNFQVVTGARITSTATVELKKGDEIIVDSATGDGPVDAAYKAIERITQLQCKLLDYTIKSITSGHEAIGEVFVKIEFEGKSFIGRGASTDIIEASILSYLNAINKIIYYTKIPSIV
jgi:2-isopropylmalate synthase